MIDDLYNLTESDVASTTEYVYDRIHISYLEGSGSGEMSGNDKGYLRDNLNAEGSTSGELPSEEHSYEDNDGGDIEAEERDSISYPEGWGSGGISREEDPDDDDDDDVSNSGDDVRDTPLEKPLSVLKKKKFKAACRKTPSVAKKSVVVENNSNTIKEKVQVAAEETDTQRVQVNAGYENPEILYMCLGSGCLGVLLKWVLTFYGTGN